MKTCSPCRRATRVGSPRPTSSSWARRSTVSWCSRCTAEALRATAHWGPAAPGALAVPTNSTSVPRPPRPARATAPPRKRQPLQSLYTNLWVWAAWGTVAEASQFCVFACLINRIRCRGFSRWRSSRSAKMSTWSRLTGSRFSSSLATVHRLEKTPARVNQLIV